MHKFGISGRKSIGQTRLCDAIVMDVMLLTESFCVLTFGSMRMISSPCWLGPDQSGSDSNASAEPVKPVGSGINGIRLTYNDYTTADSVCVCPAKMVSIIRTHNRSW